MFTFGPHNLLFIIRTEKLVNGYRMNINLIGIEKLKFRKNNWYNILVYIIMADEYIDH